MRRGLGVLVLSAFTALSCAANESADSDQGASSGEPCQVDRDCLDHLICEQARCVDLDAGSSSEDIFEVVSSPPITYGGTSVFESETDDEGIAYFDLSDRIVAVHVTKNEDPIVGANMIFVEGSDFSFYHLYNRVHGTATRFVAESSSQKDRDDLERHYLSLTPGSFGAPRVETYEEQEEMTLEEYSSWVTQTWSYAGCFTPEQHAHDIRGLSIIYRTVKRIPAVREVLSVVEEVVQFPDNLALFLAELGIIEDLTECVAYKTYIFDPPGIATAGLIFTDCLSEVPDDCFEQNPCGTLGFHCGDDGSIYIEENCAGGESTRLYASCEEPSFCYDGDSTCCEPLEYRCAPHSNQVFQETSCGEYLFVENCERGEVCIDAVCREPECEPLRSYCNSSGEIVIETECGDEYVSFDCTSIGETCEEGECVPCPLRGNLRCFDGEIIDYDCNFEEVVVDHCGEDQLCSFDECIDCPPRNTYCSSPDELFIATTCGVNETVSCSPGRCIDDTCQPCDGPQEWRCEGNTAVKYDSCDFIIRSDPCLAGRVCDDGYCVVPEEVERCGSESNFCRDGDLYRGDACDDRLLDRCGEDEVCNPSYDSCITDPSCSAWESYCSGSSVWRRSVDCESRSPIFVENCFPNDCIDGRCETEIIEPDCEPEYNTTRCEVREGNDRQIWYNACGEVTADQECESYHDCIINRMCYANTWCNEELGEEWTFTTECAPDGRMHVENFCDGSRVPGHYVDCLPGEACIDDRCQEI